MNTQADSGLTTMQVKRAQDIASELESCRRLFVITGAGMSAESGLPVYRGTGGLYSSGRTESGMAIEEVLSAGTYRRQPELVWKYLAEIGLAGDGKEPNSGHSVLAEWDRIFEDVCILTQNIDGFHSKAGSKNVIEIHGNLRRLLCTHCGSQRMIEFYRDETIPPRCGSCDRMMRPCVVLFDEMLPVSALQRLAAHREQGFDAVLSIGTTSAFPYIAEPVIFAARSGLPAIEINPSTTWVTPSCSHVLDVPASVALLAIDQLLRRSRS
jgi:NAD-dependent deacetylase